MMAKGLFILGGAYMHPFGVALDPARRRYVPASGRNGSREAAGATPRAGCIGALRDSRILSVRGQPCGQAACRRAAFKFQKAMKPSEKTLKYLEE